MKLKYSIRGHLSLSDGSPVVAVLNTYNLWRLVTSQEKVGKEDIFTFEVWLNTVIDKTSLFNELKVFVDDYGEKIDWHECTHDEEIPTSCVIIEEYKTV